jgi:hypothetical protein
VQALLFCRNAKTPFAIISAEQRQQGDPMPSTVEALSPPSKALVLLEGRAVPEFGAFWLMRPWLSATAIPFSSSPACWRTT